MANGSFWFFEDPAFDGWAVVGEVWATFFADGVVLFDEAVTFATE